VTNVWFILTYLRPSSTSQRDEHSPLIMIVYLCTVPYLPTCIHAHLVSSVSSRQMFACKHINTTLPSSEPRLTNIYAAFSGLKWQAAYDHDECWHSWTGSRTHLLTNPRLSLWVERSAGPVCDIPPLTELSQSEKSLCLRGMSGTTFIQQHWRGNVLM
jgi:hypothetical protein